LKILITGGTSKLGVRVMEYAEMMGFDVIGVNLNSPYRNNELDIRDEKQISEFIHMIKPDYIVHLAALSNADVCEGNKFDCNRTNVFATRYLAEACSSIGGRMIGISSDYVFNGKNGPYSENDATNPINEYGKAKLKGEKLIAKYCPDSLSIRSCVLYDWNLSSRRENFLVWLVNKLLLNEEIKIVDDQFATPTLIPELAEIIIELLQSSYRGILNVSGSQWISRYEFSVIISEIFGLDSSLIHKKDSSDFIQSAKRPLKGGLKVEQVENLLKRKMYSCEQGLQICKKIKEGIYEDNEWPIRK
jgi:dTDP-4-dehydrorhamnose reductase